MKKVLKNCLWCTVSILTSNFACGMEDYEHSQVIYPHVGPQGPTTIYAYMDSHGATGMYEGPQGMLYPPLQMGGRGPQGSVPYYAYMGGMGPQGPMPYPSQHMGYQGPQGFTEGYPQGVQGPTGGTQGPTQMHAYMGSYSDPVVQYYTSETVKMNADNFIQELDLKNGSVVKLYKVNYLDFSNYDLSTSKLHDLIDQADFSSIRNIDVSCDPKQGETFDSNAFLFKLFAGNSTLRSLTHIDARGSNFDKATLELLRDKTDFSGPLVRETWKIDKNTSKKVANIEVQISDTPIAKLGIDEQQKLQAPAQKQLSILYRYDNYLPGSVAHLQLQLR